MIAVRGVSKRYGGVAALSGCDLEIASPGIYGLIGPNGAGKTTLFDVLTGLTAPDSGRVLLDGRDVTGLAPHRLARLGIARSFQECRVFPEFTCLENLLFGAAGTREEALGLLELVRLEAYRDQPAAALSFGQRRLLEIAATFMVRPRILLLDEPASGVNPALLDVLLEALRRRYEERPACFLVVEHNMEFIMALASEIVVMHQGAVLERGSPEAVQASARVTQAYLG
jgi:ABC-type branched-subunit amino acid transport system ATPase component